MPHYLAKLLEVRITECMVGSVMRILLKIYFSLQQRKNFQTLLRIDKVIAVSLVYYFLGTRCIFSDSCLLRHNDSFCCNEMMYDTSTLLLLLLKTSIKDLLDNVEAHSIIDFIIETRFYKQL